MATSLPPRSLKEDWFLHSSRDFGSHGDRISRPGHPVGTWYPVSLPCTVLDGLVRNSVLPEPYEGLAFKRLPGYRAVTQNAVTYQEELHNFSDVPLPDDSPFRDSWWYRREFDLSATERAGRIHLRLDGLNYAAHVWFNGRRLAGPGLIGSVQRRYELELPQAALASRNAIALEIFPPEPDDLAFTFADWNPMPPDKCMGIWQPVSLCFSGDVTLRDAGIRCSLDDDMRRARLEFSAELGNRSDRAQHATFCLAIEGRQLRREIQLAPYEKRIVGFDASRESELVITEPRLWWPYQLGSSELYEAETWVEVEGETSDRQRLVFGIRTIESRINAEGSLQFSVNGLDLLVRGAGWAPDLMLRQSDERDETDLAYLKNMGLNAVRLEGNMADDRFFEICDREGILVLTGWICCSYWERWNFWKAEDFELALRSLRDQLLRLRNHPSLAAWLYGSDRCPPEFLERDYRAALAELAPDVVALSSATGARSPVSGPTGVKMSGPYAYVPPSYWYREELPGFAAGFNTETGPDASIMAYESLERMLPGKERFVGSEGWNLHLGVGVFSTTALTDRAVELRYGAPVDLRDYCRKARLIQYESWRAMFEAY
ncbi:MAG TPA: hypothetical protein VMC79_09310, partial [Rectinemataceae bacterium]|nr:hypothetical protein [Rectinemataceae bacterium]